MQEHKEKLPLITERYLASPELPKIVLVQVRASSLKPVEEELRINELASVINVSSMFSTLILSSSSIDFIRSLARRDEVLKILPNLELRPRANSPISY